MGILISGTTNDILVNGVSVATDVEVSSAVAPKANTADLKEIGVGQTWQDVTASRTKGTTYTNTTGKPIAIGAYAMASTTQHIDITIDSIQIIGTQQSGANYAIALDNWIIPNGSTYRLDSGATITKWIELR